MILRAVDAVTESKLGEVVVVLGAYASEISPVVERTAGVHIALNTEWREGKATSIRVGMSAASSLWPTASAALLMVCDQLHVTPELLNEILDRHHSSPESIIACEYSGTVGVPMLLPRWCFGELSALHGDQGAKTVTAAHADRVVSVAFPSGAVDIDSKEDMISP